VNIKEILIELDAERRFVLWCIPVKKGWHERRPGI